jgi:glycosyltransferase involved in cell wall biosynthesis
MKSIFLVNPISGRGHLDAYARLYARALVELGYRVVLIAESDGEAPGYLARNSPESQGLFSFVPFAECVASPAEDLIELAADARDSEPNQLSDSFAQATGTKVISTEPEVIPISVGETTPVAISTASEGPGHPETRHRMHAARRAQLVWREEGPAGVLRRFVIVPRRTARNAIPASIRNRIPRRSASHATPPSIRNRANLRWLNRAQLVWREEGSGGLLRRLLVVPRRAMRPYISPLLKLSLGRLVRSVYRPLSRYRAVRALRHFLYPDAGRIQFLTMKHYLQNAAQPSPDLVIHLYLDMMAQGPANLTALDSVSTPWVGILFHPKLAKTPQAAIERYFESRTARGGIFLVPPAIDIYAKALPHLKFVLVPDVADLEFADDIPAIARDIKSRAKGRKVILQVGSIAPHKGIMTLLEVCAKADPKQFFFAFVGEVHWHSFGPDQKRLRTFYACPPENVCIHEGYVNDERDYNTLVATCDVIYAVYRGFNSSSNSLTKAAGLRRPILVAKDTLMGERVLNSEIGSIASEGNARDILMVLESLAQRSPDSFGFDHFMQEYSLERLKSVLAEALPQWINEPSR